MQKLLFFILTIFTLNVCLAASDVMAIDTATPFYGIQRDQKWVSAVKHLIRKGYPDDAFPKFYSRQISYIQNCINLGQYYERLFDQKKLPDMKKALYFYEKITILGKFNDDERVFKALALRNNLCRKVADIYFTGKGVKKNLSKSFKLALKGVGSTKELFPFYSKRYFGCNCRLLNTLSAFNLKNDTIFKFVINPFLLKGKDLSIIGKEKELLVKIGDAFVNRNDILSIVITAFPEPEMYAQSVAQKLLNSFRSLLENRSNISPDKIFLEMEVRENTDLMSYIKGATPFMQINFTKSPPQN